VFERFTEPARQVVVLAQDEARALGHGYIGTEHLLLGILREEDGLGARVLRSLGVTVDETRVRVARVVGIGEEPPAGQIPFTPHAKRALELSLQQALSLGSGSIGTEHLLLGLACESHGVGAQILNEAGVHPAQIMNCVVRMSRARPTPAADVAYQRAFAETQSSGGWTGYAPISEMAMAAELKPIPANEPMLLRGILVGWTLFGLASGIGLLVGWLIWG
jgi:ATP-dependent Clp protease ATP-binding subunit ClpA